MARPPAKLPSPSGGSAPPHGQICECPICGRSHWALGFGKPPVRKTEATVLREALTGLMELHDDSTDQEVIEARRAAIEALLWKDGG